MLHASILAYLTAFVAAKLVFSDIAVYGINRCVSEGLGPSTSKIALRAPYVYDGDHMIEGSFASVEFNDEGNIVFNAGHGGSSGFLKHATIMTGESVDEHVSGNVASDVKPGDFVMAIIKHSPNLTWNHLTYDSIFKGHGDDTAELVRMFRDRYGHEGSFTLVTALVAEADAGHGHYYTLVPDLE